jgi:glycosyltransferase involved in cell wall biosynthesis
MTAEDDAPGPGQPGAGPRVRRVVLTWLSTAPGGAERSVLGLAAGLRQLGTAAEIVWWSYGPDRASPRFPPCVPVTEVRHADEYQAALAAALDGAARDTVIVSAHRTAAIDIAAGRIRGVPVAAVMRALLADGCQMRYIAGAGDSALSLREPAELDWDGLAADAWIGISRASSNSVRKHARPGQRIETIYNGVGPGAGEPDLTPRVPRCFLLAGRLEQWKEPDRVLRAFTEASTSAADITLDVIGDGPMLAACEELASETGMHDRITLHGHQENPEDWIARADVLVHGAPLEAFGRVIAEAGMRGRPAIAPRGGGAGEIVIDGVTGITYAPSGPQSLVRAILAAAAWPPTEWHRMAAGALALSRAAFTMERTAAEYLMLCNALLYSRPDAPGEATGREQAPPG